MQQINNESMRGLQDYNVKIKKQNVANDPKFALSPYNKTQTHRFTAKINEFGYK